MSSSFDPTQSAPDVSANYSGGDTPVGAPCYRNGNVVAYSPAQAKIIFENLLTARFRDMPIPFLVTDLCNPKMRVMLQHMMWHQQLDPAAIGIAAAKLHDPQSKNLMDYRKCIEDALGKTPENFNDGFVSKAFRFHIAPTIRVENDGEITELVLDPGICSQPVTFREWAQAQGRNISICHGANLGNGEIRCVYGKTPAEGIKLFFHDAHSRGISGPQETFADPQAWYMAGLPYAVSFDKEAADCLQIDRKAQENLVAIARERGIALPNCGPRALQTVQQQLGSALKP